MSAEQDVGKLQESKTRMEMLIRYFQQTGNKEAEFVEELEDRLRAVRGALGVRKPASAC